MDNDAEAASWTYHLCFGVSLACSSARRWEGPIFEVEVEQVNILGKTAVLTPVQFVDTSMPVFFLQTFFH
jgi:hypothetical protein